jgi:hypothetical protein
MKTVDDAFIPGQASAIRVRLLWGDTLEGAHLTEA